MEGTGEELWNWCNLYAEMLFVNVFLTFLLIHIFETAGTDLHALQIVQLHWLASFTLIEDTAIFIF